MHDIPDDPQGEQATVTRLQEISNKNINSQFYLTLHTKLYSRHLHEFPHLNLTGILQI